MQVAQMRPLQYIELVMNYILSFLDWGCGHLGRFRLIHHSLTPGIVLFIN